MDAFEPHTRAPQISVTFVSRSHFALLRIEFRFLMGRRDLPNVGKGLPLVSRIPIRDTVGNVDPLVPTVSFVYLILFLSPEEAT